MKTYESPVINIEVYEAEDTVMTSGVGLTNGGAAGKSIAESFSSLFGDK